MGAQALVEIPGKATKSYNYWLAWWRSTITTDDYFKFLSTQVPQSSITQLQKITLLLRHGPTPAVKKGVHPGLGAALILSLISHHACSSSRWGTAISSDYNQRRPKFSASVLGESCSLSAK